MEPTIVECQNYNAIRFNRNDYELINKDNARFEYSTYRDTLESSLKDTPYCLIGFENGRLYCNRLSRKIDKFETIRDIEDFLQYADILPKHISNQFENVPTGKNPSQMMCKNYYPNWEYRLTDDELNYLYHSMTKPDIDPRKFRTFDQQRKSNPYRKNK